MLNKIKKLSTNELLSKAVIYRELNDLFTNEDLETDILKIIDISFSVYLKKDYATLIGVAQSAREYLRDLREQDSSIASFNSDTLFTEYHGVGEWY